MSFNNYTPLNKLNSSKIKWNIRVRVQALWKGITRETKEFRGINMILVDDSKFRIHAFINARFSLQFEKQIEEGQIYVLSNFIVQEYSGVEFHRCLRFEKHIFFADYTKVEKNANDVLKIPHWSFDIFNLLDLENMQTDKHFLCDVVGIIQDVDPIVEYLNDNKEAKKQKKFAITDGSCTVKVTFFDELAHLIEEALKKEVGENNIVIISSAKIGSFQGELNLTNYPATRFYININHQAVKDLRKRASEPTFSYSLPSREDKNIKLLSINEIKNLGEEDIEKQVVCEVTIKKVEEDLQWYDRICRKCNVEVHLADARFKCEKCGRFYTWPPRRFRVCVLCCDGTGVIPVILGDLAIKRLTSKTFFDFDLDLAEGDDSNKFPDSLKQLKNRHCYVTLDISADKMNNESDGYEAVDIALAGEYLFPANSRQESFDAEDDSTIADTDLAATVGEVQSPPTAKSTVKTFAEMKSPPTANSSAKIRVRKSPEIESGSSKSVATNESKSLHRKKETQVARTDGQTEIAATQNLPIKKHIRNTPQVETLSSDALPVKKLKNLKKNKGKEVVEKSEKSNNPKFAKPATKKEFNAVGLSETLFDEDCMTLSSFQNTRKMKAKISKE